MESARNRAEELKRRRVIDDYFVIAPESLAGSRIGDSRAETALRRALVTAAESYLGAPYLWRGSSAGRGFDSSGLIQAVYKLNGLSIPGTSRELYERGNLVSTGELRGGDLLFFSGGRDRNIAHVAIYVENGNFIYAPGQGQPIRRESLNAPAWSRLLLGARSYL